MVEQLAELVASFDPWWMVAIAIALVLLDWALLHTEAFITLGLGTLILAVINALDFSPIVQLWAYPVAILASFFLQRRIFELITTAKSPYKSIETMGTKGLEVHIGQPGNLKLIHNKNESLEHFFSYKDKMEHETKIEEKGSFITKVELKDGTIFPSTYVGDVEMTDGMHVTIVGVSNGALLIK